MKIGLISSDWSRTWANPDGTPVPGGAGWYRIAMPARELRRNGVETVVSRSFGTTEDGAIMPCDFWGGFHDDCDVIVFQRWTRMEADRVCKEARAAGQKVVNDVDDWFFGIPPSNVAFQRGHPTTSAVDNWDHYRRCLAASDALTVSTPYLAKRLERICPQVHVVRNAVDLGAFTGPPFVAEKPVVGWVGSTAHRSGDLETLRGVLWPVMERHGLSAFHGGAHEDNPSFAEAVGIPPAHRGRALEAGMVPITEYPGYFVQFDLGIVPLTMNPFNRSKSAIKGMEYAAARLPFVAQATDEYLWFGAGITCQRPRDWIKAFERLIEPAERSLVAAEAHERVKAEDISVRWSDWAETYAAVLSR